MKAAAKICANKPIKYYTTFFVNVVTVYAFKQCLLHILYRHTVHIFIHVVKCCGNNYLLCICFALAKVESTRWSYPCMAAHPPSSAQDKVLCGKNSERHCSSVSLTGQPIMINWSLRRWLIKCTLTKRLLTSLLKWHRFLLLEKWQHTTSIK